MDNNSSSSGSVGWEILKSPAACSEDIVFLHGLTGSRRSTFTHRNGRCWPQDFLPEALPHARIMTFGYDADVVDFKKMASQNNLRANAKSLLEALVDARRDAAAASRPLYFVTHSLGGLLCKQTLILARSRPQFQQVFDACAGIIFIATPHKGSKQAKLGGALVGMVNVIRPANKGLLKILEEQSPELCALDDDFWALMDGDKRNCNVHCYHESAPMSGLGIIVSSESAARPGGSSSSLEGNHKTLLKFETNQNAGYQSISSKLSGWIDALPPTRQTSAINNTANQSIPRCNAVRADSETTPSQSRTIDSAVEPRVNSNDVAENKDTTESLNNDQAKQSTVSISSPFNDCTFQDKVFPNMVNNGGHSTFNFN